MAARPSSTWVGVGLLLALTGRMVSAREGIEFITEHLPEALLDNRIASLPIWDRDPAPDGAWRYHAALGYSHTSADSLVLAGPLASFAVSRALNATWSWSAIAFLDRATFRSATEQRVLQPRFATDIPLALPADAWISNLTGAARGSGAGIVVARGGDAAWLGSHRLLAGLLWQRLQLRQYSLQYRVVSGPSAGAAGTLDYSATYSYVVPLVGVEWRRVFRQWNVSPHLLAALPLPARALQGRIRGPGFDIAGNTAAVGRGKHVGEPYLGFGLVFTYRPLGLSVDIGSTLSQATIERLTHAGLERNLLVGVSWQF